MADNKQRPIIQSSGYNGSEPTRICPHCGKGKKAKMGKSETSLGVKIADKTNDRPSTVKR